MWNCPPKVDANPGAPYPGHPAKRATKVGSSTPLTLPPLANHVGKLLGQRMVDEIGSFVPMPHKFSGEFFCNTYVAMQMSWELGLIPESLNYNL